MLMWTFLALSLAAFVRAQAQNCFDLNNANVLTFRENYYTSYRLSAPIQQLECRSDYYTCQSHRVHIAECRIATYDRTYGSPRWTCTSPDLPPNVFLKNFVVSCEKCSNIDTYNKLMGSCGLRYEIGMSVPPSNQNQNLGGGVVSTISSTISTIFFFLFITVCCCCGWIWCSCCGSSSHGHNEGYSHEYAHAPPPPHGGYHGVSGYDNGNHWSNSNTTFMYAPSAPLPPPVAQPYTPSYDSFNYYGETETRGGGGGGDGYYDNNNGGGYYETGGTETR